MEKKETQDTDEQLYVGTDGPIKIRVHLRSQQTVDKKKTNANSRHSDQ